MKQLKAKINTKSDLNSFSLFIDIKQKTEEIAQPQ